MAIRFAVWSLLPAVAHLSPDISASFRHLAPHLAQALAREEELRPVICTALLVRRI